MCKEGSGFLGAYGQAEWTGVNDTVRSTGLGRCS